MNAKQRKKHWSMICDAMRHRIACNVLMMDAMKPEEMEKFIEAARSLQSLEREADTQNAETRKRLIKAKVPYGD